MYLSISSYFVSLTPFIYIYFIHVFVDLLRFFLYLVTLAKVGGPRKIKEWAFFPQLRFAA